MPPGSELDISLTLAQGHPASGRRSSTEPMSRQTSTGRSLGSERPNGERPESDVSDPTQDRTVARMNRRSGVGQTTRADISATDRHGASLLRPEPRRKRNRKNTGEGRHSLRSSSRPWTVRRTASNPVGSQKGASGLGRTLRPGPFGRRGDPPPCIGRTKMEPGEVNTSRRLP